MTNGLVVDESNELIFTSNVQANRMKACREENVPSAGVMKDGMADYAERGWHSDNISIMSCLSCLSCLSRLSRLSRSNELHFMLHEDTTPDPAGQYTYTLSKVFAILFHSYIAHSKREAEKKTSSLGKHKKCQTATGKVFRLPVLISDGRTQHTILMMTPTRR